MKRIISLTLIMILALSLFASCGKTAENEETQTENLTHHKILFTMENGETFTIETYPEYAPQTCDNFVNLAQEGFYNGLTFHRVIENFMAQGGMSTEKQAATITGEFAANGYEGNTLKHTRGIVSMARANDMNSASSQFFICYTDCPNLDGNYAAFGEVVEGMETVDAFLDIERVYSGRELSSPKTPIVIKTAEVIE